MPIFEYRCPQCGTQFEELVFTDETPTCPKCGSKQSEKLMSCAARRPAAHDGAASTAEGGGCGGCSGGHCASCGH